MKNPTHPGTHQRNIASRLPAAVHCRLSIVRFLAALVLAALALAPSRAQAQASTPNPPGQISYQGFLTDANGAPLATNAPANYSVTFRIYNSPTTTTPLWGELQTVTVDKGYFSVLLGQGSAVSGALNTNDLTGIFTGSDASSRYLGMTVTGLPGQTSPTEIQPRLRLMASPYALLATHANSIVGNTGAPLLVTQGTAVGINETPSANDGLDVKGNVGVTGNVSSSGNLSASGNLTAASINSTGNLGVSGTLTAGNITSSGTLTAGSISSSGSITTAGSIITSGAFSAGSVTSSGALAAGNITSSGTVTAAALSCLGFNTGCHIYSADGTVRADLALASATADYSASANINDTVLRAVNGGKLLLQTGAGGSALAITAQNNVGIGTASPGYTLDVNGSINAPGNVYFGQGTGYYVGYGAFSYPSLIGRPYGSQAGTVLYGANGGWLGAGGTYSFMWEANGDCQCRTVIYGTSDRAAKEKIEEITPKDVLDKVSAMPITKWSYTNSPARHIGPMAQDFRATFNLGRDDKTISLMDESGIALAAIKGLHQEVKEKDAELQALKKEVADLKTMVESLAKGKNSNP